MPSKKSSLGLALMMVTASAAVPQNAGAAETVSIAQALAFAYSGNPALGAERARQRATDEAVPQALSGWRPTIIANADAGLAWTNGSRGRGTDSQPLGASVTVSQPIF